MTPSLPTGSHHGKYAIAGLCALFGLSLGAHYGVSDQNLYLLPGIRLADPAFLSRDWYVTQTAQHYAAFTYLVYALQKVGPLPWTSGALYLLLKGGVAVSAYFTLRALHREPFLPFLSLVQLDTQRLQTSKRLLKRAFKNRLVAFGHLAEAAADRAGIAQNLLDLLYGTRL